MTRGNLVWIALAAALLGGCSSYDETPPSSVEADDARIAADVSLSLRDAELEGWEGLRVLVTSGEVVLEGELASKEDERTAIDLARKVRGVQVVVSRIGVGEPAE